MCFLHLLPAALARNKDTSEKSERTGADSCLTHAKSKPSLRSNPRNEQSKTSGKLLALSALVCLLETQRSSRAFIGFVVGSPFLYQEFWFKVVKSKLASRDSHTVTLWKWKRTLLLAKLLVVGPKSLIQSLTKGPS